MLSILKSPGVRVLAFRFLLSVNVILLVLCILSEPIMSVIPLFTNFHHLWVVFKPIKKTKFNIALVFDTALVLGELVASICLFSAFVLPIAVMGSVDLVALCLTLYFRIPGIRRGTFDFFGGCDSPRPQYTPWKIILGNDISEPLVRGESRNIIIFRTFVLLGLCLSIPAFGIYVVFIVPIVSPATIRDIKVSQSWLKYDGNDLYLFEVAQNITIVSLYVGNETPDEPAEHVNIGGAQGCQTGTTNDGLQWLTTCPFSWLSAPSSGLLLSVNFTDPWGILYVKPGQGDPSDVDASTVPIPLVAGARLSVVLSTMERKIFSKSAIDFLGFSTPFRTILVNSVLLLQSDPSPPNATDTAILRLRLRKDMFTASGVIEDFTDASVLAGFATFGGFWTFTNGAFAMLFGANLLYFLSKRRPLSALGMIHIFQKRALMQNWNEDFPALHTEGGLPGSESAGIVAFIRERLVDVDEQYPKSMDAESQHESPVVADGGDNTADSDIHNSSETSHMMFDESESAVSHPVTELEETSALGDIPLEAVSHNTI
ncbi:hypothetical protein MVEN_00332300 [Mycena venus]|uniref:Uncharacterized protein n=1 Tax=Mycena venus TaxID=2733690 RepID=A0A8H7D7V5_9AGAR|nr:hypothetical protein MVEN_00332300 [Mycena venus]